MVEYVYSEKDRSRLDKLEKSLREYLHELAISIKKEGKRKGWADSEMRKAFLEDPMRNHLAECLVKVKNCLIPLGMVSDGSDSELVIKNFKEEFGNENCTRD